MCEYCERIFCPPMCPNYDGPDEEPVCYCSDCGEGIMEDEAVVVFGDKVYCESCLDLRRTFAESGKELDEQSVVEENKRILEDRRRWK